MVFSAYNISFRRDSTSSRSNNSSNPGGPKSSPLPPPGPATERANPFDDLSSEIYQRSESPGASGIIGGGSRRGSQVALDAIPEMGSRRGSVIELEHDPLPYRRGSIGLDGSVLGPTSCPSSANKSRLSFAGGIELTKNTLAEAFSNFAFPSSSKSNSSTGQPQPPTLSAPSFFLHRRPSMPDAAYQHRPTPPPMEHRSSVPNIVISGGHRAGSVSPIGVGLDLLEGISGKSTPRPPRSPLRVGDANDLFSPKPGAHAGNFTQAAGMIGPDGPSQRSGFIEGTRNAASQFHSRPYQQEYTFPSAPASHSYKLPVPPKGNLPPAVLVQAQSQMIEHLTRHNKDAVLCSGEGSFVLPSPVYRALRGEQGGYDSHESSTGSPTSAVGRLEWTSTDLRSQDGQTGGEKLSPNYKSSSARLQPGSPSSPSERYASTNRNKKMPTPPASPSALPRAKDSLSSIVRSSPVVQKPAPSPPKASSTFEPEGPPPHCVAEYALANHQLDETFLSLYQIRDELGSGGFGFVCSAWSVVEHCEVAVKFIYKSKLHHKAYVKDWHRRQSAVGILPGAYDMEQEPTGMRSIPMEAALLQYCQHPGIVAFHALYEDKTFFYLVQELHGSPWSKAQLVTVEDVSFVNEAPNAGLAASTSGLQPVPTLLSSASTSTFASMPSQPSLSDVHVNMHSAIALMTPSLSGESMNEMQGIPGAQMSKQAPMTGLGLGSAPGSAIDHRLMNANEDAGLSPAARPGLMARRSSHDLFERIETQERFSDQQARYVFAQIVDAVAYLHRNGIVHRDIKDENVVIDDSMTVKLIDFGSAVIYDARKEPPYYTRFYGTMNFASAEIVQGYPYQAAPAEVWSLGVLLSILLTGAAPYDGPQNATDSQSRIKNTHKLHPDALDLLWKCLEPNPNARLTIEHVRRHRWLVGSGLERVSQKMSPDGKERIVIARNPVGFRPISHEVPRASSRSAGR